jgi:hypothetical protein
MLNRLRAKGLPAAAVARILGRSKHAVRRRSRRLAAATDQSQSV